MKTAFLFPGQGSQAVGMGKELTEVSAAARAVFTEADAALGFALSRLMFDGPAEELKRTHITQPAILTASVAAMAALNERGVGLPHFVAGHSLGEYSALVAASAMTLRDAVVAVRARGTFMQEAVPEGTGAMAAVLGLDADTITAVIQAVAADPSTYAAVANYNGPEQTVIAGSVVGIEAATAALKAKGAKRVMPLPVSAPFHCALMAAVKPRLLDVLTPLSIAAPTAPVVTNVEAVANSDAARIVPLLIEQVTASVRFTEMVRYLLAQGVTTFVEVGPGKVLNGIVKRMAKDQVEVQLLNVEDKASLEATVAALRTT